MTRRILLCDDELHILKAAEFKFKRAGYEVATAADGEQAWELLSQHLPDILITDCQMPRMNGLHLAERVKNDPRTGNLPVIMLSAKGFELSDADLRAKFGILALVAKPFSPRDLFERVEKILNDREAEALKAP
jgi:two-component system, OmpR family, alkaline phosphatase synthesis response regulator PhoP